MKNKKLLIGGGIALLLVLALILVPLIGSGGTSSIEYIVDGKKVESWVEGDVFYNLDDIVLRADTIIKVVCEPLTEADPYFGVFKVLKTYEGDAAVDETLVIFMPSKQNDVHFVTFLPGNEYLLFLSSNTHLSLDAILDISTLKTPTKYGDRLFRKAGRSFNKIEQAILNSDTLDIMYVDSPGIGVFREPTPKTLLTRCNTVATVDILDFEDISQTYKGMTTTKYLMHFKISKLLQGDFRDIALKDKAPPVGMMDKTYAIVVSDKDQYGGTTGTGYFFKVNGLINGIILPPDSAK